MIHMVKNNEKSVCDTPCGRSDCKHYYRLELWKHAMTLVLNWRFLIGLGFLIAFVSQSGG